MPENKTLEERIQARTTDKYTTSGGNLRENKVTETNPKPQTITGGATSPLISGVTPSARLEVQARLGPHPKKSTS